MTALLLPPSNNLHLVHDDGDLDELHSIGRTLSLQSTDADADHEEDPAHESDDNDDEEATERPPSPTTDDDDAVMTFPTILAKSNAYGGIRNLGNTCYFNSALQLLASLDSFTQALRSQEPRVVSQDAMDLRTEFLNVMEALSQGETVHPDSFKKALDARSPLFLGYRQQDSHEFLTTLLELFDEDYQRRQLENNRDNDESDHPMDTDDHQDPQSEPQLEDEQVETDDMDMQTQTSPLQLPRCLSELDVDDISELLSGSPTQQLDLEKPSTRTTTDNNFKLIGGRINNTCTGVMQWLGTVAPVADEDTSVSSATSHESLEDAMVVVAVPEEAVEDSAVPPTFTSPVDDYFTTQVRVQLTCDSCKYTRSHLETYRHLSLEIGTNGGSIEEGLRKLFSPEKRDIKCEKCFCECATQTTEIVRLPRALLLHFKRFIVDYTPDFRSATYRKNHATVQVEDRLMVRGEDSVMEEFLASDVALPEPLWSAANTVTMTTTTSSCQHGALQQHAPQEYRVRGIVNHHGASASCGHYNADAHKLYRDGQCEWTRFNDSTVSKITPKQALEDSSRTAYMVVYELVSSTST